jgi:hypothetical protein
MKKIVAAGVLLIPGLPFAGLVEPLPRSLQLVRVDI